MPKQIVTLRLDEDDLTYLAELDLPGAANLSEKIRLLLADARAQRAGLTDHGAAYDFIKRLFSAPQRAVRAAEVRVEMRSELVNRVLTWLPDIAAFALAGAGPPAPVPGEADGDRLRRLERGLGERALALVDSMLQLARAGFPGCHEPEGLTRRAQSALVGVEVQGPAAKADSGGNHE